MKNVITFLKYFFITVEKYINWFYETVDYFTGFINDFITEY